jgi:hypothetical protein
LETAIFDWSGRVSTIVAIVGFEKSNVVQT